MSSGPPSPISQVEVGEEAAQAKGRKKERKRGLSTGKARKEGEHPNQN